MRNTLTNTSLYKVFSVYELHFIGIQFQKVQENINSVFPSDGVKIEARGRRNNPFHNAKTLKKPICFC